MTSWTLVPCLVTLRGEFDALNPRRDRGADGTIGDRAHAERVSDHNADDTPGSRTPFQDADHRPEVHALDVDDTGPWPNGTTLAEYVEHIRLRERAAGADCRLQNIIHRGRVASRSWGWAWREVPGIGHFDHAHFSARYTTKAESDTSPYGLAAVAFKAALARREESTVQDELVELTAACAKRLGNKRTGEAYKAGDTIKLSLLLQHAIIASRDAETAVERMRAEMPPL